MARVTETAKSRAASRMEGILKEGMVRKHLTYAELAVRTGVSARTLSDYRKDPMRLSFAMVARLSDVLGIPEDRFFDALRNVSSR